MSLKPPKRSDLNKSWMKPRRDNPKKIQPEYHLIVTEGTDTEPSYFGAMKDIINSKYSDHIQLGICGTGVNTLSLFQKAKQLVSSSANGYRHVWVVYDTDDFPAAHIDKIHIWMPPLQMLRNQRKLIWESSHQLPLQEQKCMNS